MESTFEYEIMNKVKKIREMGLAPADPCKIYGYFEPLPIINVHGTTAEDKLEVIIKAVESASTLDEQLNVSCGMPLIYDRVKERYYLASTALDCIRIQIDILNNQPKPIKLISGDELKKRFNKRALLNK